MLRIKSLCLLMGIGVIASAQADTELEQLKQLSLDELANIEISIVSRTPQKLSSTAAAVSVITAEDIRRSGATSIPELLRTVPGLQVARIDANKWAISARGFNQRFANKLLVLIDGRSVYTPLFSGVYWDVQDTLLEDIERIEVIRGPGAAVWGANAVNGVINIITKTAQDTQGGLLIGGVGSEEQGLGAFRYGGKLGESTHYRVYGKAFHRDAAVFADQTEAADDWDARRFGFRVDSQLAATDRLTVQGDIYDGESGQSVQFTFPRRRIEDDDVGVSGGNLLARWSRDFTEDAGMQWQLYYDRTRRDDEVFFEKRDTFDVEFQHRFRLGQRHRLVWGLGYRSTQDETEPSVFSSAQFVPDRRSDEIRSVFIQDDINLLPDTLALNLGLKYEHNDFTGDEFQPSARLSWTPNARHTFWGAVSHAVRSPSRVESDFRITSANVTVAGNPDFQAENLTAYELGYRSRPTDDLSLDVAAFYNRYTDLQTLEPVGLGPPPIPVVFDNKMDGEVYGLELAANWNITPHWRLRGAYSWLRMALHRDADSRDSIAESQEGDVPENQLYLQSLYNWSDDLELDAALYYVDSLPSQGIPAYLRFDLRLGWRPFKDLELSIAAQNLLDDRHPEFENLDGVLNSEVERAVYGKIEWRF